MLLIFFWRIASHFDDTWQVREHFNIPLRKGCWMYVYSWVCTARWQNANTVTPHFVVLFFIWHKNLNFFKRSEDTSHFILSWVWRPNPEEGPNKKKTRGAKLKMPKTIRPKKWNAPLILYRLGPRTKNSLSQHRGYTGLKVYLPILTYFASILNAILGRYCSGPLIFLHF